MTRDCLTPNEIKKYTNLIKSSNKLITESEKKKSKIQRSCVFFIMELFNVWDYNELLMRNMNTKTKQILFNCLQFLDGKQISHKDMMQIYNFVIDNKNNVANFQQKGGDCGDCGGGCGGACDGKTGWF